jgi:hypothetical protein
MWRFLGLATFGALLVLTTRTPKTSAEQGQNPVPPQPDVIKWNLDRLNKNPFKLIKSAPDPQRGQVRFVVELTRRPELTEIFDWENRGGPVVFRFRDDDGIILRTVKPRPEGESVAEKGARFRLVLLMPDQETLNRTRSITAE